VNPYPKFIFPLTLNERKKKFRQIKVTIPDSATRSLEERPTALNIEVSVLRSEVGAGMLVLAAD
jgi:hypothetical protein